MFCPKCGNEMQEGSAFCGSCGAKVGGTQAGSGKSATDNGASTTDGANIGDSAVAAAAVTPKKGKGAAITVAVVAVAIVAIVCVNLFGGGGAGPLGSGVTVKSSTNDYSWDELSKISTEIAQAPDEDAAVEAAKKYNLTTADGKLDGNQMKSVTLTDGTQTSVLIAGFAHDEKANGGKAGITFIFKDSIFLAPMNSSFPRDQILAFSRSDEEAEELYSMMEEEYPGVDTSDKWEQSHPISNAGGWESSELRNFMSKAGMEYLPSELRNVIVTVNKLSNNVGQTKSASSISQTPDDLWLFSLVELAGPLPSDWDYADVYNAEGSIYTLFEDMGMVYNQPNEFISVGNGFNSNSSYSAWWERSPDAYTDDYFFEVDAGGRPNVGSDVDSAKGVVPGFCI